MILIPAIDIKDGKCVRLKRGLIDDSTEFGEPIDMARIWSEKNAKRLHLVDLNGAFAGNPINRDTVLKITREFPNVLVQIGGGIRTMKIADDYLNAGVNYLIIGSMAVTNPEFISELCREFVGKIIVGLDANDGQVAIDGWATKTDINVTEMAKKFEQDGVNSIIYTDIARDGMMQGVNVEATVKLAKNTSIPIIASGGITNMNDINNLLSNKNYIFGAVTGRAIYEGTLDFQEANELCK